MHGTKYNLTIRTTTTAERQLVHTSITGSTGQCVHYSSTMVSSVAVFLMAKQNTIIPCDIKQIISLIHW